MAPHHVAAPPNTANPIKRVAILPMLNNSPDVEAPARIRDEFFKRLGSYHYDVQPVAETNDILNHQMGITMGKQYDYATPQEIGKTLGVDGLFYGYLLDFDEVTIGVANTYKVRMGWKLVDTKTGQISWGKGIAVIRTASIGGFAGLLSLVPEKVDPLPGSKEPMTEMPGLDKWVSMGNTSVGVAEGVLGGILKKVAGSVMDNSLQDEINFAYGHLFPTMLRGPGVQ